MSSFCVCVCELSFSAPTRNRCLNWLINWKHLKQLSKLKYDKYTFHHDPCKRVLEAKITEVFNMDHGEESL